MFLNKLSNMNQVKIRTQFHEMSKFARINALNNELKTRTCNNCVRLQEYSH